MVAASPRAFLSLLSPTTNRKCVTRRRHSDVNFRPALTPRMCSFHCPKRGPSLGGARPAFAKVLGSSAAPKRPGDWGRRGGEAQGEGAELGARSTVPGSPDARTAPRRPRRFQTALIVLGEKEPILETAMSSRPSSSAGGLRSASAASRPAVLPWSWVASHHSGTKAGARARAEKSSKGRKKKPSGGQGRQAKAPAPARQFREGRIP